VRRDRCDFVAEVEQKEAIAATVTAHLDKFATASTVLAQRMVHQFGELAGKRRR
jgi:hypothetical protein